MFSTSNPKRIPLTMFLWFVSPALCVFSEQEDNDGPGAIPGMTSKSSWRPTRTLYITFKAVLSSATVSNGLTPDSEENAVTTSSGNSSSSSPSSDSNVVSLRLLGCVRLQMTKSRLSAS